ncbi:MAG: YdcH family protein [Gammaproteobacteria bacterium]|nr:YdcH family protein [Gammaproteobacteria bacterium]
MNDKEIEELQDKLHHLRIEHRDMDDIIQRLQQDPATDQLQLVRLKKRKLMLKDTISRLESQLIPDLNA